MSLTRLLITGGCGFFGHHVVEHILKNTDWEIIIVDRLTYASFGYDRLRDIGAYENKRVSHFAHDLCTPFSVGLRREIGLVDYILHCAAETHVDNSIVDPRSFVFANVVGTLEMLEFARCQPQLQRFVYFSTDEVFGPANNDDDARLNYLDSQTLHRKKFYFEWDRYNSTNPYSATKAGGEELCLAYANTYGLPIIITHCMNLFGERQHPEKFIPSTIRKVLNHELVTIHADSMRQRPGSRFYLHCRNGADAVLFLLSNSSIRDKYNIVGDKEYDNLALAERIAATLNCPLRYQLVDFHSSRPGHDLRYGLSGRKLAQMGWTPPLDFDTTLEKTIEWMIAHPKWLESKTE